MAEKLTQPTLIKRTVNSNNKGPTQTILQETAWSSANPEKSPPMKKKTPSKPAFSGSATLCDTPAAGASREVNVQFSHFAGMLSETAAADTSQMKQLDGILIEARNFESCLKEKKKQLRQTLALISDNLQG
ncbi:testis-expressed protein 12-like isoform X5 [Xyrichtys novacula]|uniref:Testis-expressed protein 12-like isoform X5 n=1 Tax=Xyrichtys novacula TaxID=13765 RepID=A0AAV1FXN8_XYRNO|nr:testis-expressed protein 12-like isoform X5 [Xyrichtys novacula]